MKTNNLFYKRALPLLAVFFLLTRSYAGNEIFNARIASPAISSSSTFTVQDDKYTFMQSNVNWSADFFNKKITNRVILSIDQANQKFQSLAYSVTVNMQITYSTWNTGTNSFQSTTVPKSLTVDYSPTSNYKDKSVYEFIGGNLMTVKVTSIVRNPGSVALSQMNLSLESEIEVERYYAFDPQYIPTVISHNSNNLVARGELDIWWGVIPGAEEYDLEWAYINNYGPTLATETPAANLAIDERTFQFNSTRITTTNTFYSLPYIYGKGYILYRVRGVGKTAVNNYTSLMEGRWSSYPDNYTNVDLFLKKFPDTGLSGPLNPAESFIAHNDNLNWQFSVSYAEDGKSKAVVSYFDGSLHNRQSVTKIKTDDKIIVGESIYDHQGRPAIQVLPVPVNSAKINFTPNFNQNLANIPYTKENFDLNSGMCPLLIAAPMNPAISGASNYYSPNNTDQAGQQAFVPDAQQFPFTQVEYTADNTGRIRSQSGVGSEFKLGSGHETNYFYGAPEQEEIDRLFGSEAGNASHYKKNMVRDANGQLSISYLDPQGRVIATSLTGKVPDNVQTLSGINWNGMTIDLINKVRPADLSGLKNELNLSQRTLKINKEILVGAEAVREFKYEMRGAKYDESCSSTLTWPDITDSRDQHAVLTHTPNPETATDHICYDCVLDLKISLTDECNKEYLPGIGTNATTGAPTAPLTIGTIPTDSYNPRNCTSIPASYSKGFTPDVWETNSAGVPETLKVGNYSLNKTLTVNQQALDIYTDNYLKENKCLLSYDYFLHSEIKNIDFSGCDMTCEECVAQLQPYSKYDVTVTPGCDPCLTEDEWQELVDQCNENCEEESIKCDAALQNMLLDMSPQGQYGQLMPGGAVVNGIVIDPQPSAIDPAKFPLSVFNTANQLPRKQDYYTAYINTSELKNGGWAPTWRFPYNPNQPEAKRFTYLDEKGEIVYIPVKEVSAGVYSPSIVSNNIVETVAGQTVVRPQFLLNLSDFVDQWEPDWANALVAYHPEHCYYDFCTSISTSHDFDDTWLELDKIADVTNKWSNNFMNPVASGIDPYYTAANPHLTILEKDAMLYAMDHYQGGKSIWEVAYLTVHCPNALSTMGCSLCTYTPGTVFTTDAEWNTFKSMYIGLKQKFQQQVATRYAINQGCYNGCIGADQFNPFLNNFYHSVLSASNQWVGFPWGFTYFRSQFYNFEQPCNWARFQLYKEKQQRFPGINDLFDINALNTNTCYDPNGPVDVNGNIDYDGTFEVVDCPSKSQETLDEIENLTTLSLYQQCGKCPNAQHLELFLNALVTKTPSSELLSSNLSLSCYPAPGGYLEFTENLAKALMPTLTSLSNVTWNYNSGASVPTSLFVGSFNSGTESCELKLHFPASNTLYTFSDIVSICCVKYITNPVWFAPVTDQNFQLTATVRLKPGDLNYDELDPNRSKEIIIEGTSCIQVGGCTFDPICKASKEAVQLQNIFNALLFRSSIAPAITQVFTSTTDVSLVDFPFNAVLDPLKEKLDAAIDLATVNPLAGWTWTRDAIVGNSLTGHITAPGQNAQCDFVFNLPQPASAPFYSFEEILSFSNIKPDPNGPSGSFLITALIKNPYYNANDPASTQYVYIQLTGSSSCFNMGECTDKLPNSFVSGYTKNTPDGIGTAVCTLSQDGIALQTYLNDRFQNGSFEGTGSQAFFRCGVATSVIGILSFPVSSGYDFSDIVSLSGMIPDPAYASLGPLNSHFIIYATMENGDIVKMHGNDPCTAVGGCELSPEFCPAQGENLLSNGDFEQGNTGFTSEYTYIAPNAQISEGSYSVLVNANTVKTCCWQGLDHTNGYGFGSFMVVDRTDVDNMVVWQHATIPVKPNTDYRFTAWVSTVDATSGNPAKLQFSINNTPLGAIFDAPLTLDTWIKYYIIWNSGANTQADIKIVNKSLSAGRDDFGLDDIAFQENCTPSSLMCDLITIPMPPVTVDPNPCATQLMHLATTNATTHYDAYIAAIKKQFQENYIKKCLTVYEDFFMQYEDTEHHFTLYYYDQPGNLVRTIPPAGVKKVTDIDPLDPNDGAARVAADMAKIRIDRADATHTYFTKHSMATTYKYNSLNQLVAQTTPDNQNLEIWNPAPANMGIPPAHTVTNTVFHDGSNGYAFTTDPSGIGHIYLTFDGGTSWSEITNIGLMDLNDIQYTSISTAYTIGQDGTVLKTTDGGTNWIVSTPPTIAELLRIDFETDLIGRVYEKNGRRWETTDGGSTWSAVNTALSALIGTANLTDLSFNSANGFAVSDAGKIYATGDKGVTWLELTSIKSVDQNKVFEVAGLRLSIGKDGTLLKSTDLGNTWQEVPNALDNELKDLHFTSATNGFVIEDNAGSGTIKETTTGGTVWTIPSVPSTNYKDLFFYDATNGYAVTANGSVSKYNGSTWSTIGTATSASGINTIYITDPSATGVGYMGGNSGNLYKTADGGATWSLLSATTIPTSEHIVDMHFSVSAGVIQGVVLTGNGNIYSNTDIDGTIFSPVLSTSNLYSSMHFISTTNGFTVSENGFIATSTDGGLTWTESATALITSGSNKLKSIFMTDATNGTVTGENGELWITVNGGATWTSKTNTLTPPALSGVSKIDANNAYAAGADGTIIKTADGGANWQVQLTATSKNLADIHFASSTKGAAVGEGGYITYTSTGTNWLAPASNINTNDLKGVVFTSSTDAYAAGKNFTVVHTTDGGANWDVMTTTISDGFNAISKNPVTAGELMAVGEKGKIFKLTGGSWVLLNQFTPPVLNDAQSFDATTAMAVGKNGSILVTTQGGGLWNTQTSGTIQNLNAIHIFPSSSFASAKAIVVGDNGTALQTLNGGTTWTSLTGFPAITTKLNDVHFSGNYGIIVGNGGIAYTSINGGSSWTAVSSTGTGENLNAVHVVDNSFAYAVGDQSTIIKITATGATWTPKVHNPSTLNWVQYLTATTQHLNDVYFRDYVTGYAIGNNGIMLKTFTGGETWVLENLNEPGAPPTNDFNDLTVIDNNNFFISGSGGNITHLNDMKDEFASLFWYDKLGRLVVSQNAKQFNKTTNHHTYSYTLYDALGRITEVGEIAATAAIENQFINLQLDDNLFAAWIAAGAKTEVTTTAYDVPTTTNIAQDNLRKRVAATYFDDDGNSGNGYDYATHYSYDIHGNVKMLVQDNPSLASLNPSQQYKHIGYEYDLVSGNVHLVQFQAGQPDAFYHKYEYDADNRITNVFTSKDAVIWDQDGKYFYYQHGPLARTEIGNEKVQGTDYAYTIQGWIKGINSANLDVANDMGKDANLATAGNLNKNIAKDVFGYSLNYFNDDQGIAGFDGDYKSIGGSTSDNFLASVQNAAYLSSNAPNLFNGNISSMVTTLTNIDVAGLRTPKPQLTAYQYDQLNRIKQLKAYRDVNNLAGNDWATATSDNSYESTMSYDANGNILAMKANGSLAANGLAMDDLQYKYENIANGYTHNTNKLRSVDDLATASLYTDDIKPGQIKDNYVYDEIGNLIADDQEGIANIEWTVYGKIKSISRKNGFFKTVAGNPVYPSNLEFKYDPSGNRIAKIEKPRDANGEKPTSEWITTYYVRDASGNIMANYQQRKTVATNAIDLYLTESNLYGSSRLGVYNYNEDVNLTAAASGTIGIFDRKLGRKQYEMSNHLGNVLTTVSDRKIPVDVGSNGTIDYFQAEILSTSDYYAFGSPMPGRTFTSSTGYRYGYNGQEKDNEIKGEGNSYNFKYRMHDARLGRFFSVDPIASKFPYNSPYAFAENRVIDGRELEGLEVFLIGGQTQWNVFWGESYTSGVVLAPNGVYGFTSKGESFATNVGFASGMSITIFPDMKRAQSAAGLGYMYGIGGGYGFNIDINSVTSDGYVGINLFVGYGASAFPIEFHKEASFTTLYALSAEAKKAQYGVLLSQARTVIKSEVSNLQGQINDLKNQNNQLASENATLKKQLKSASGSDKMSLQKTIDDNTEKYWNNYNQYKEAEKNVNNLTEALDTVDSIIGPEEGN